MSTKNEQCTGFAATWRSPMTHLIEGTDLSGGAFEGAFTGIRMRTFGGESVIGVRLANGSQPAPQGTRVSETGAVMALLRDESELALDRGEHTGDVHASSETPRLYGALGECPRRIPA
ncbi:MULTISPECIES: hypothetical protein [Nocardiopsis]|uniref:Uncharacterized protein n=2 Tax=Nocardiopsis alba TaxID=53437 RepID=A0A7K2IQ29_9ACTN|nr:MULTISPECIES: hypothetical protein [Nocardiopsis]MEC3893053.1 hypothetical protein [Nocardiopsis sp. LDBS1602]MYR32043.1 hypothetical protein [Nocardiopsis alba]